MANEDDHLKKLMGKAFDVSAYRQEMSEQHEALNEALDGARKHKAKQDAAVRDGAAAARETSRLLERMLEAQIQLIEAEQHLVEAQAATEKREQEMLVWTRVAGIGAVLALVVSVIAIVVTLATAS